MGMTPEQRRDAAERFTDRWEATHPRREGESATAYYLRGIMWLSTPEGFAAFKAAAQEAAK
jgi:hypothetical protein